MEKLIFTVSPMSDRVDLNHRFSGFNRTLYRLSYSQKFSYWLLAVSLWINIVANSQWLKANSHLWNRMELNHRLPGFNRSLYQLSYSSILSGDVRNRTSDLMKSTRVTAGTSSHTGAPPMILVI